MRPVPPAQPATRASKTLREHIIENCRRHMTRQRPIGKGARPGQRADGCRLHRAAQILIVIVLLIACGAPIRTKTPADSIASYTNADFRFSVAIPEGLTILRADKCAPNRGFGISLSKVPYPIFGLTLKELESISTSAKGSPP